MPSPGSDSVTLSAPVLVVYVKHARPVSERTRLDIWLGHHSSHSSVVPLPLLAGLLRYSMLCESQHVVVGSMISIVSEIQETTA